MPSVDLETAIADFLRLGKRLQSDPGLTGDRVLEEMTDWFRQVRVDGADSESDGDMLLFQWGTTRPILLAEPTDMRSVPDSEVLFPMLSSVISISPVRSSRPGVIRR